MVIYTKLPMSNENIICRYCLEPSSELKSELIFPCSCKTPVCTECLIKHIQTNNKTECEICQNQFDMKVIEIPINPPVYETGNNDLSTYYIHHNDFSNDNLNTHLIDNSSHLLFTRDNFIRSMVIIMFVLILILGIIYRDKIRFL